MGNFEKLGAFYLGRHHDLKSGKTDDTPLLYDARDLTTHAICVGMTGSGKTGLCISMLEEAALDGVPAIVIDPKGDLGNLMLTFPDLRPEDFKPWVEEGEARRKEMQVDEYAARQAELWREGLASWGQDGERIRRLRDAADFAIYTPGSDAGLPVSILDSFAAPPEGVRGDRDLMRDRVTTTTTSLLGMMGVKADPIRSREQILIATILDRTWREGRDLDLAGLIQAIQQPPVERIGVMDLDSFYPAKDRFELAMQLNNLLAAPGFEAWLSGEPLNVQNLLYTATGKPRVAIFSIAHLSDSERMFFVSLLVNQVLGWTRSRPGTQSLRALIYMDEIFGFIPPTAEPPSKRPFLTLLKQARAHGVGVMLATQNPVDLDYRGLSNTGTWFIGRLQTERDKMRVLEGLEGAAAGAGSFDKNATEQMLAGLGKRVFLMHNVHEDGPAVFHTRWAMSYLRGPLTRQQIAKLMEGRSVGADAAATSSAARGGDASRKATGSGAGRPVLPPSVPQFFVPSRNDPDGDLVYRPGLLGLGRIQYVDRKSKKLKHSEEVALLIPADDPLTVDWQAAREVDLCREELEQDPEPEARYGDVPADAGKARSYTTWKRELSNTLYRTRSFDLMASPALGLTSEPGESERDFRVRLADLSREKRDRLAETLRKKYARRVARLEERIRRAEQRIEKEEQQASSQKMQTVISLGATVMSALLGRKAISRGTMGRATTAARGIGRVSKEKQDIRRAAQNLDSLHQQLAELNEELEGELDQIEDRLDPLAEELETVALRPRRSDVDVRLVALTWVPDKTEV